MRTVEADETTRGLNDRYRYIPVVRGEKKGTRWKRQEG